MLFGVFRRGFCRKKRLTAELRLIWRLPVKALVWALHIGFQELVSAHRTGVLSYLNQKG